jgi:hypothetical protein
MKHNTAHTDWTDQLHIIKCENTKGTNTEILQRPKIDKHDIKYLLGIGPEGRIMYCT